MRVENVVVETPAEEQKPKKEPESAPKKMVMKAVLIKTGELILSNSLVLPSLDVCLLGEPGTVLVPQENVLPIMGVGGKDLKCNKCGYLLAMKIEKPQVQNITIKCPSCGRLNEYTT